MSQSNLKHLFVYSQQQKTKAKRGIVYSILNKLFDLAPPVLIGIAIDIVVEGNESFLASLGIPDRRRQLVILAILTFIIWGLESLFDYLSAVTWRGISQDIEHSLRTETFENVLSLDMKYFENKSSGRLMAILNDDVNQLERFLDTGANKLLQTATTVIGYRRNIFIYFTINCNVRIYTNTHYYFWLLQIYFNYCQQIRTN